MTKIHYVTLFDIIFGNTESHIYLKTNYRPGIVRVSHVMCSLPRELLHSVIQKSGIDVS